jgi:FkbM family methyltransferase
MNGVGTLKDYLFCAASLGQTPTEKFRLFWQELKNVRVRLKLAKYQPEKVLSFQTTFGPLYFRDNFGDITNMVNLLYRREYRLTRLSPPGVILDVGANIGMAAVWFHHYNPDREIFCFEPLHSNADLIRLNCPHAKVFELALGSQQGTMGLSVDQDEVMASAIPTQWKTTIQQFPIAALDAIAVQEQWKDVAMLKMDVEGMEVEILKGAKDILRKTHHVVAETHSRELHEQVTQQLVEAGFSIDFQLSKKKEGTALLFASRHKKA